MDDALNKYEDLQVIALVASAGGLAAVAPPLGPCLADRDAAVIVVIHQAPDRWSALVHLLARRSRLSLETGRDEMPRARRTVVVAPPAKHILIGVAPPRRSSLREPRHRAGRRPISVPTTLAIARDPRATAMVLSGDVHPDTNG